MVNDQLTRVKLFNLIQDQVERVEEKMRVQSAGNHPDLGNAYTHLLSAGGKRVRPAVALLVGGMLGADQERLVTLGAAIELLHSATLVHDDLIDGAVLRRGIVTLNAQWSPAATVLTGDFIFARAAKLAAETDSVPVMRLFADTLAIIVNGEITQLFNSRGLASHEDYFKRIHAKTASMFELASAAAALLSPVDSEVVEYLRGFGYDIGMAFQIVDDVLAFTGEQAMIGKPVASDLRQGLITLPALFYLELYPDDPVIRAIKEDRGYPDSAMDQLVTSIRESGVIDKSMDQACRFIESALDKLSQLPECEERDALDDLASYIVERPI
jgi:geranylgeranyl pyrophosphate synthase